MALTPDKTRVEHGLTIHEKIIPWGAVWTKNYGKYTKGTKYKADRLLSGGTGKAAGVTIHNTDGGANAETYTRATYPNQNMKDSRVHYYVDDVEAWQNLLETEVGWHAGDGRGDGNETTISIEIIMRGSAIKSDEASEDNGAKLAAILLVRHGLSIDKLYKHKDWSGKQCPLYIIPHWDAFKAKVQAYMAQFAGSSGGTVQQPITGNNGTYTVKAGDTLSGIAETYLGSAARYPEIKSLNGLTSDLIKVGQVLKLPVDGGASTSTVPDTSGYTEITGTAAATAAQMRAYITKINPDAPDLAAIYLEEGEKEGIRGDVAFAQSCLETGNWRFGGDVKPEQNNYCGMGATGGGVAGNSFETPRLGIRAQIQHLKAYANTEPLSGDLIDPRFAYVKRGCAPYVEWLGIQENPEGRGWASGADYGAKILKILAAILATAIEPEKEVDPDPPAVDDTAPELDNTPQDWEKSAVEKAISRGIIQGDTSGNLKLHSTATRADVLVFLERAGVL
nr:MAG TPA: N-acetylmuramoyl-L-alanine amidase [Caudoviricetes sp.]